MLDRIASAAAAALDAVVSVVGVRAAAEPPFTVLDRVGQVEIRRYEARLAAEVRVGGEEYDARGRGFGLLAGYIFGGNAGREKIAMTAPVAQERAGGSLQERAGGAAQERAGGVAQERAGDASQERAAGSAQPRAGGSNGEYIAMTAPVAQAATEGGWTIRFFMPADRTRASLPAPNDPAVTIVEVPGATMAVLRFSGVVSAERTAERRTELLGALAGGRWQPTGDIEGWFYDPPWTLPPLRRNEVAVAVTDQGAAPPHR